MKFYLPEIAYDMADNWRSSKFIFAVLSKSCLLVLLILFCDKYFYEHSIKYFYF